MFLCECFEKYDTNKTMRLSTKQKIIPVFSSSLFFIVLVLASDIPLDNIILICLFVFGFFSLIVWLNEQSGAKNPDLQVDVSPSQFEILKGYSALDVAVITDSVFEKRDYLVVMVELEKKNFCMYELSRDADIIFTLINVDIPITLLERKIVEHFFGSNIVNGATKVVSISKYTNKAFDGSEIKKYLEIIRLIKSDFENRGLAVPQKKTFLEKIVTKIHPLVYIFVIIPIMFFGVMFVGLLTDSSDFLFVAFLVPLSIFFYFGLLIYYGFLHRRIALSQKGEEVRKYFIGLKKYYTITLRSNPDLMINYLEGNNFQKSEVFPFMLGLGILDAEAFERATQNR